MRLFHTSLVTDPDQAISVSILGEAIYVNTNQLFGEFKIPIVWEELEDDLNEILHAKTSTMLTLEATNGDGHEIMLHIEYDADKKHKMHALFEADEYFNIELQSPISFIYFLHYVSDQINQNRIQVMYQYTRDVKSDFIKCKECDFLFNKRNGNPTAIVMHNRVGDEVDPIVIRPRNRLHDILDAVQFNKHIVLESGNRHVPYVCLDFNNNYVTYKDWTGITNNHKITSTKDEIIANLLATIDG